MRVRAAAEDVAPLGLGHAIAAAREHVGSEPFAVLLPDDIMVDDSQLLRTMIDTHARYVYVHGTNHEDRIGQPLSAGCVLMRNLEIVELYEEVRAGDLVWIAD